MATLRPFKAVRPHADYASRVASLPYDVMNSSEARQMAEGNPYSFLHVSRAEIDLAPSVDEHAPEVYRRARENFDRMQQDGILIQDSEPRLYIYAQVMDKRIQVGLVACSSVDDYFNDVIKKHEFTRPEKEQDRIEHMEAMQAHVGPIFLTYPKNATVSALTNEVMVEQKPIYDFDSSDGIHHTVWTIDNQETILQLVSVFKKEIPFTYIADGHHRTASAAKVGQKMRDKNPNHTGQEEYNFFLSVLFPSDHLAIMDYNRLVKDLNGMSAGELIKRIEEKFVVTGKSKSKPAALHEIDMYLEGSWYQLKPKHGVFTNDPIGVLDITILQDNVLNPLLGIKDPRTDKRIDFVGGIRGLDELERRVNNGEMKVAFALYPVSIQQLIDIADSGQVMPPKSTWFEPKLRDGLFSHLF